MTRTAAPLTRVAAALERIARAQEKQARDQEILRAIFDEVERLAAAVEAIGESLGETIGTTEQGYDFIRITDIYRD